MLESLELSKLLDYFGLYTEMVERGVPNDLRDNIEAYIDQAVMEPNEEPTEEPEEASEELNEEPSEESSSSSSSFSASSSSDSDDDDNIKRFGSRTRKIGMLLTREYDIWITSCNVMKIILLNFTFSLNEV